jgi:hypothetical protein
MFFYRIERLNNLDTMNDDIANALKGHKFTVIPLVSPSCAVGEFLMDPEKSADISENSEPLCQYFLYCQRDKSRVQPIYGSYSFRSSQHLRGRY